MVALLIVVGAVFFWGFKILETPTFKKTKKNELIINADKNVNLNYNMRINAVEIYNLYNQCPE